MSHSQNYQGHPGWSSQAPSAHTHGSTGTHQSQHAQHNSSSHTRPEALPYEPLYASLVGQREHSATGYADQSSESQAQPSYGASLTAHQPSSGQATHTFQGPSGTRMAPTQQQDSSQQAPHNATSQSQSSSNVAGPGTASQQHLSNLLNKALRGLQQQPQPQLQGHGYPHQGQQRAPRQHPTAQQAQQAQSQHSMSRQQQQQQGHLDPRLQAQQHKAETAGGQLNQSTQNEQQKGRALQQPPQSTAETRANHPQHRWQQQQQAPSVQSQYAGQAGIRQPGSVQSTTSTTAISQAGRAAISGASQAEQPDHGSGRRVFHLPPQARVHPPQAAGPMMPRFLPGTTTLGHAPRPLRPHRSKAGGDCPELDWVGNIGDGVRIKGSRLASMQDGIFTTAVPHMFRVHSTSGQAEWWPVDMAGFMCSCPNDSDLCSHLYALCCGHPEYRLKAALILKVRRALNDAAQQRTPLDDVLSNLYQGLQQLVARMVSHPQEQVRVACQVAVDVAVAQQLQGLSSVDNSMYSAPGTHGSIEHTRWWQQAARAAGSALPAAAHKRWTRQDVLDQLKVEAIKLVSACEQGVEHGLRGPLHILAHLQQAVCDAFELDDLAAAADHVGDFLQLLQSDDELAGICDQLLMSALQLTGKPDPGEAADTSQKTGTQADTSATDAVPEQSSTSSNNAAAAPSEAGDQSSGAASQDRSLSAVIQQHLASWDHAIHETGVLSDWAMQAVGSIVTQLATLESKMLSRDQQPAPATGLLQQLAAACSRGSTAEASVQQLLQCLASLIEAASTTNRPGTLTQLPGISASEFEQFCSQLCSSLAGSDSVSEATLVGGCLAAAVARQFGCSVADAEQAAHAWLAIHDPASTNSARSMQPRNVAHGTSAMTPPQSHAYLHALLATSEGMVPSYTMPSDLLSLCTLPVPLTGLEADNSKAELDRQQLTLQVQTCSLAMFVPQHANVEMLQQAIQQGKGVEAVMCSLGMLVSYGGLCNWPAQLLRLSAESAAEQLLQHMSSGTATEPKGDDSASNTSLTLHGDVHSRTPSAAIAGSGSQKHRDAAHAGSYLLQVAAGLPHPLTNCPQFLDVLIPAPLRQASLLEVAAVHALQLPAPLSQQVLLSMHRVGATLQLDVWTHAWKQCQSVDSSLPPSVDAILPQNNAAIQESSTRLQPAQPNSALAHVPATHEPAAALGPGPASLRNKGASRADSNAADDECEEVIVLNTPLQHAAVASTTAPPASAISNTRTSSDQAVISSKDGPRGSTPVHNPAADAVIEDIRKKEFGIGLALDPTASELLAGQHRRLRRALEGLAEALYSRRVRLLMELLQNADDCSYPKGTCPTLALLLRHDGLSAASNECGFSEKDVRAMCDVGASSKALAAFANHRTDNRDGRNGLQQDSGAVAGEKLQTGEKGIGFKSVFAISDKPHVSSNGYNFHFHAQDPTGLGFVLPHLTPGEDRALPSATAHCPMQGWQTVIWLPAAHRLILQQANKQTDANLTRSDTDSNLRPDAVNGSSTKAAAGTGSSSSSSNSWVAIAAELASELGSGLLLFLRNVRRLVLQDDVHGTLTVLRRHDRPGGIVQVDEEVHDLAQGSTQRKSFTWVLGSASIVQPPVLRAKRPLLRTAIEVALLITQDDSEEESSHVPQLYAHLPVKPTGGLRFDLQADWVLTSSREDVLAGDAWNQMLREKVPQAFLAAVRQCLQHAAFATAWLPHVPVEHSPDGLPLALVLGPFLRPVPAAVCHALRSEHCLPDAGGALRQPGELMLADEETQAVVPQEQLHAILKRHWLSSSVAGQVSWTVLQGLGLARFSVHDLLRVLQSGDVLHKFATHAARNDGSDARGTVCIWKLLAVAEQLLQAEQQLPAHGRATGPHKARTDSSGPQVVAALRKVAWLPVLGGGARSADTGVWLPLGCDLADPESLVNTPSITRGDVLGESYAYGFEDRLHVLDLTGLSEQPPDVQQRAVQCLGRLHVKPLTPADVLTSHVLPALENSAKNEWLAHPQLLVGYGAYLLHHCHLAVHDVAVRTRWLKAAAFLAASPTVFQATMSDQRLGTILTSKDGSISAPFQQSSIQTEQQHDSQNSSHPAEAHSSGPSGGMHPNSDPNSNPNGSRSKPAFGIATAEDGLIVGPLADVAKENKEDGHATAKHVLREALADVPCLLHPAYLDYGSSTQWSDFLCRVLGIGHPFVRVSPVTAANSFQPSTLGSTHEQPQPSAHTSVHGGPQSTSLADMQSHQRGSVLSSRSDSRQQNPNSHSVCDYVSRDLELVLEHLLQRHKRATASGSCAAAAAVAAVADQLAAVAHELDYSWSSHYSHFAQTTLPGGQPSSFLYALRTTAWLPTTAGTLQPPPTVLLATAAVTALLGPAAHVAAVQLHCRQFVVALQLQSEPLPAAVLSQLRAWSQAASRADVQGLASDSSGIAALIIHDATNLDSSSSGDATLQSSQTGTHHVPQAGSSSHGPMGPTSSGSSAAVLNPNADPSDSSAADQSSQLDINSSDVQPAKGKQLVALLEPSMDDIIRCYAYLSRWLLQYNVYGSTGNIPGSDRLSSTAAHGMQQASSPLTLTPDILLHSFHEHPLVAVPTALMHAGRPPCDDSIMVTASSAHQTRMQPKVSSSLGWVNVRGTCWSDTFAAAEGRLIAVGAIYPDSLRDFFISGLGMPAYPPAPVLQSVLLQSRQLADAACAMRVLAAVGWHLQELQHAEASRSQLHTATQQAPNMHLAGIQTAKDTAVDGGEGEVHQTGSSTSAGSSAGWRQWLCEHEVLPTLTGRWVSASADGLCHAVGKQFQGPDVSASLLELAHVAEQQGQALHIVGCCPAAGDGKGSSITPTNASMVGKPAEAAMADNSAASNAEPALLYTMEAVLKLPAAAERVRQCPTDAEGNNIGDSLDHAMHEEATDVCALLGALSLLAWRSLLACCPGFQYTGQPSVEVMVVPDLHCALQLVGSEQTTSQVQPVAAMLCTNGPDCGAVPRLYVSHMHGSTASQMESWRGVIGELCRLFAGEAAPTDKSTLDTLETFLLHACNLLVIGQPEPAVAQMLSLAYPLASYDAAQAAVKEHGPSFHVHTRSDGHQDHTGQVQAAGLAQLQQDLPEAADLEGPDDSMLEALLARAERQLGAADGEPGPSRTWQQPRQPRTRTFSEELLQVEDSLDRQVRQCLAPPALQPDWVPEQLEARQAVGRWGEEYVYRYLLARADPGTEVVWVNESEEAGLPYDILVTAPEGDATFIEVKASSTVDKMYFEISHNEWIFAQQECDHYHIYRLAGAMAADGAGGVRLTRIVNPYKQWRTQHVGLCLAL